MTLYIFGFIFGDILSSKHFYSIYLLWRNLKSLRPHVNLLVDVYAGDDAEDAGSPGSPRQQPAQPEDDGPLVLLHHLHHEHEGERGRDHDQEERAQGHDEGADAGTLLATCRTTQQNR